MATLNSMLQIGFSQFELRKFGYVDEDNTKAKRVMKVPVCMRRVNEK